jgi:hypothetical protein
MLNIEKYDNQNISFLKYYFAKKEQKINVFLIESLTKQRNKLKIKNKEHLARMDKLADLTDTVFFIDNVELFSDGNINEPSYKNVKKMICDDYKLNSYNSVNWMQGVIDIYNRNIRILEGRIKNYVLLMKRMKSQERSLKKFIKILYEFNFTKAKSMSNEQIRRFFKSRFNEFEFI